MTMTREPSDTPFARRCARRRFVALLLAGLACAVPTATGQSTQGPTRHIDTVELAGAKVMGDPFGKRSKEFRADSRDGPVWLVYYFIGEVQGDEQAAEAAFEMFFEGVKMSPTDTFALFRARYMRPVSAEDMAPGAPGTPVPLAAWAGMPSVPEALERALGAQAAQRYATDPEARSRLRHVVVGNHVTVPPGDDTFASFSVSRVSGLKPLYLRVHIGQGPIPRELEQWSRETSGPWLVRYRKPVIAVAALVVLGLFVLWRLGRRS